MNLVRIFAPHPPLAAAAGAYLRPIHRAPPPRNLRPPGPVAGL